MPVVVVNAEPANLPVTVITSDSAAGSRLAVQHLVSLGHRRIAYVRGSATFTADIPRFEGFRRACKEAGLAEADTPDYRGDGQFEGGERAAAELLGQRGDITAIACYNDVTAIGVLRTLRAVGRRVPADISVVGCDDIAAASWVVPALTTVVQQKADMGRRAIELLARSIDDPGHAAAPEVIRLPMSLKVRESTGPAPAA